jgi:putative addiction module component (TIGR02574 family)
MKHSVEHILNEAMNLKPSERAVIAQQLINSISTKEDEIEQEWLNLVEKRFHELKSKKVTPVSWKEIKERIKIK